MPKPAGPFSYSASNSANVAHQVVLDALARATSEQRSSAMVLEAADCP